jgi:hypothetical protein
MDTVLLPSVQEGVTSEDKAAARVIRTIVRDFHGDTNAFFNAIIAAKNKKEADAESQTLCATRLQKYADSTRKR